ncbi:MAG: hypothetical protein AAF942_06835 [Pseudomonadota bacterium]
MSWTQFRANLAGFLALLVALVVIVAAAEAKELPVGKGSFEYKNPIDGDTLTVWYYRPEGTGSDAPIVFVMHGTNRNGATYRDNWVELAQRDGFLVVVPEFTKSQFPGSRRYNMGNVFRAAGGRKPQEEWAFNVIEGVFDDLKSRYGMTADSYDIFGHSAGSQFVHRMVLFMPDARIGTAVAANAGWYTMVDEDVDMPYGLAATETPSERIKDALGTRMIILLGEEDNDPNHRYLRRAPEAMAQGAHRFERGQKFYDTARAYAQAKGIPFDWEIETVPGVAHSNRKMAPAAAKYVGKGR